jgi:hypothetical protein
MKLCDQAIGAIMMALQKSLMEQTDIVPTLKEMEFVEMDNGELVVENPPIVNAPKAQMKEIEL